MVVLVIDDSLAMRSLLRRILSGSGFEVIEAGGGAEGLDTLRGRDDIQAVLVDWQMPGMDGCEFIRAARAADPQRELPIMMVTAESELDQVAKALAAGADEYVMKPFTRDAVLEKLNLLHITSN
jgi:two-component system chemotaxis response regulator CheY